MPTLPAPAEIDMSPPIAPNPLDTYTAPPMSSEPTASPAESDKSAPTVEPDPARNNTLPANEERLSPVVSSNDPEEPWMEDPDVKKTLPVE
ncbi:MAG: hypothetical protein ACK55I_08365, partial [bacterium]